MDGKRSSGVVRIMFGWWYPPGAANDPMAPYNQTTPPESFEVEIGVAVCYTCEEKLGPNHIEDIGHELFLEHEGHDTEVTEKWTEEIKNA